MNPQAGKTALLAALLFPDLHVGHEAGTQDPKDDRKGRHLSHGLQSRIDADRCLGAVSERIWYGAGNTESARRVGVLGMRLMSSTLVLEATGEPLGVVQHRQIEAFRQSWQEAGHAGEPCVSVSRSIMPIVGDVDKIVRELRDDAAVMSADTVLITIPNQLGSEFNRITFDPLVEIRDQLS